MPKKASNAPKCNYCNRSATLVSGNIIYPHRPDLYHLRFWQCAPCNAYVGCHKNSKNNVPLGRLANAELRRMKSLAHASFDSTWKSGGMTRGKAYGWLASKLGIDKKRCHIGEFDVATCKKVIGICS